MKKNLLFISIFLCSTSFAQSNRTTTYTVAGGKVEVYDASSQSWKKLKKDSSVKSNEYVRSEGSFTLRGRKGFSQMYPQCDSVLVSSLSPMKMVATIQRGNDVITRDVETSVYRLDKYSITLHPDSDWSFDIMLSGEERQFDYEVIPEEDWIMIDNPSGVVQRRTKVSGKINVDNLVSLEKLEGRCRVKCGDVVSTVTFVVSPAE